MNLNSGPWENADDTRRADMPHLKTAIAEARSRMLKRRFPNLADDQAREIAWSEERWQAILKKARR